MKMFVDRGIKTNADIDGIMAKFYGSLHIRKEPFIAKIQTFSVKDSLSRWGIFCLYIKAFFRTLRIYFNYAKYMIKTKIMMWRLRRS